MSSNSYQRGDIFIWLSGAAVALSLSLVWGLFLLILVNGLQIFWPNRLEMFTLKDGSAKLGVVTEREEIPSEMAQDIDAKQFRLQVRQANRDVYGEDFFWLPESSIVKREFPDDVMLVERAEWGRFFGYADALFDGDRSLATGVDEVKELLPQVLSESLALRRKIKEISQSDIGRVNRQQEQLRVKLKSLSPDTPVAQELVAAQQLLEAEYQRYESSLSELKAQDSKTLVVHSVDGQKKIIPIQQILAHYLPNQLSFLSRAKIYVKNVVDFIKDDPRESNTEGGVFPAIFGTVLVVFIMSFVVTPFGVLAAIYLREYATQGRLVSIIRIAVNNLAGVPSIVFGVFGVGFFVYVLGGSIDRLFFSSSLPIPTFGTGGLLWASLTLALLTVPTVIVATEEGLASIPKHLREGSYALGATKFETTWRVVLPALTPSILTGVILAVARAAGEVAPLMITGVVKLAPTLPIDGVFPFLHFDRKFMHLGFHIYDVGFQSPNVEAARPMVFAATFLLLVLVVLLNLAAMLIRNRLRQRFATSAV